MNKISVRCPVIMTDGGAHDTDKLDPMIWTDDQVFKLIELKAKYSKLFTGKKGSALIAYGKVAEELGMRMDYLANVKKKWENLADKYKKVRCAKMDVGDTIGEKAPVSWKYYDAMDEFMKNRRADLPITRKTKLEPIIFGYAQELDPNSSTSYQDGQMDCGSEWELPEEEVEETAAESQVANVEKGEDCNDDNLSFLENEQGMAMEEEVRPHKRRKHDRGGSRKEGRRSSGLDLALGIALAKLKQISESVLQDTEKVTEFDLWAKSVASQLNAMEVTRALRLQLKLQTLVTEERLLYESSRQ